MFCKKCGYNLTMLESAQCPECGRAFVVDNPATWSPLPYTWRPRHALIGFNILALMLIWLIMSGGDGVYFWLDISTLIWIGGCNIGVLWICFGPAIVFDALAAATRKHENSPCLALWLMVFTRAYQATWAAGIIGLCANLIIMLNHMDDPAMIGPGISYAMFSPLYAAVLGEFIIVPLQHVVAMRHNATPDAMAVTIAPRRAMYSIMFAVMFAAIAIFGWLMLATTR